MTLHIKSGGSWLSATPYAKSGGVWQAVQQIYVKVSGVWTQVYTAVVATLTNAAFSATNTGFSGVTVIGFNANGTVDFSDDGAIGTSNWITPTTPAIGASYYVRMNLGGGNGVMSGSFGSWLSLASAQTWSMAAATFGVIRQRSCTYQISQDQSTILATGSVTFLNDNS